MTWILVVCYLHIGFFRDEVTLYTYPQQFASEAACVDKANTFRVAATVCISVTLPPPRVCHRIGVHTERCS